jgi:CheY-like chemotaxis protein
MTIRILYLDDEKDMVDFLPLLLKQKNKDIEVVSIGSIPEALDLLRNENFDGILLDIMMPPIKDKTEEEQDYGRTTGIEVAREMKSIKPEVPIIAFTALTDSEIRQKIRAAGVVKIINRPAEVDEIALILKQTISGD